MHSHRNYWSLDDFGFTFCSMTAFSLCTAYGIGDGHNLNRTLLTVLTTRGHRALRLYTHYFSHQPRTPACSPRTTWSQFSFATAFYNSTLASAVATSTHPRLRRHHHRRHHHRASRCTSLPRVSTLHSDHLLLRRSKGHREWPRRLCHPDGCYHVVLALASAALAIDCREVREKRDRCRS